MCHIICQFIGAIKNQQISRREVCDIFTGYIVKGHMLQINIITFFLEFSMHSCDLVDLPQSKVSQTKLWTWWILAIFVIFVS